MRYIKDGPFKFRRENESTQTVGEMLAGFAGGYVPIPALQLTTKEIRILNDAEDSLGKPEDGWLALEDAQFDTALRVIPKMVESTNKATSAPLVEDILNEAVTEKPESAKVINIGTG